MPRKITPPVPVVPIEPTETKIPNKWGASEAKWMVDHEDVTITVRTRSGNILTGYLIGTDHYTLTIEAESGNIVVYKHAIDSMT